MNWIEDIKRIAADEKAEVTREWMEQAMEAAPFSVLPALLFLKHNGVKGNEEVLEKLAINFPDRHALSLMLGEDAGTLEDVCEPYLMQIGFLTRTPRGRCVTPAAYNHLGIRFQGGTDDIQTSLY